MNRLALRGGFRMVRNATHRVPHNIFLLSQIYLPRLISTNCARIRWMYLLVGMRKRYSSRGCSMMKNIRLGMRI